MTTGSVLGHLARLSIPASMGMIFNTLYNLTDFWFAGRISDDALAGVSIAGSVFFLLLAVGIGIQTGASAVIAPESGRGQRDRVAFWVDQAFGLALFFSVLVTLCGWFLAEPLIRFLGAEPHVAPLSMEYIATTLWGSFTFILTFAAAGALMAIGDTRSNRNALAMGFLANLLLNPLLTFGLQLGVTGLALATVLIKGASALYLYHVLTRELGRRSVPRCQWESWLTLLRQVLPASFNMLTIIVGGFITLSLIGRFGSEHVAGYSVGLRLEQVLLLPALGLNTAVMAIAGQNLGAGQPQRVRETYIKGLQIGLAMAAVSIPVMVYLSPAMMSFFSSDPAIQATGATYLRIDAIAFYAYVVLFLSTATLQAMKRPLFPMYMGIARQLVIPVSINYWLIVHQGFPMMSIFYTIISVVVIASLVAHWYTLRQLLRLAGGKPETESDQRPTRTPLQ
ncbi:MATE family efflux transporter [Granulosicoccus sp. 3-233]|uniref:MATE family efflux transporter n=1 Tax=Granulosicoccus sp. 3-233 TaxID=3417969 RepID=UPI003D35740C